MKKLLTMLSLISTMSAQTNLVLGLNVSHVNFEDNFRDEYKFCDGIHNNLFGIEQINGKNSYCVNVSSAKSSLTASIEIGGSFSKQF